MLQSERKIRAMSLLKFSHITVHDLDSAIDVQRFSDTHTADTHKLAIEIGEKLKMEYIPSKSEENIVLYVCGAICKSTLRKTKCSSCKDLLCSDSDLEIEVNIEEFSDHDSILNFQTIVSRGGLLKPTDYAYTLCIESFRVFEEMKNNKLMPLLLKSPRQRELFRQIVQNVINETTYMNFIFGHDTCTQGHCVSAYVVFRFFNAI